MDIKRVRNRRMPRVGVIRLGIKVKSGNSDAMIPKAIDYFHVGEDASTPADAAAAFHEVYGEKPTELDIMFASDDPAQLPDPGYSKWSASLGRVCKGDGDTALAKWDTEREGPRPEGVEGGTWASAATQQWVSRSIPCHGPECPMQQGAKPSCKGGMSLQVLLPRVRGIGVWQITTGSERSTQNVLDSMELIRTVTGRIRGLPLKLRIKPTKVTPKGEKTKTVYVLEIPPLDVTLETLVLEAAKLPQNALLPAPIEDDEPPGDIELEDTDVFPDPPAATAEPVEPALEPEPSATKTADNISTDTPATSSGKQNDQSDGSDKSVHDVGEKTGTGEGRTFTSVGDFLNACFVELNMNSQAVCSVLGVKMAREITDLPSAFAILQEGVKAKAEAQ